MRRLQKRIKAACTVNMHVAERAGRDTAHIYIYMDLRLLTCERHCFSSASLSHITTRTVVYGKERILRFFVARASAVARNIF